MIEAGDAMGMTRRQLLWLVEFPLALPSIVAGVRVATVIGVGTATIAAAIGAGGLGEYSHWWPMGSWRGWNTEFAGAARAKPEPCRPPLRRCCCWP